MSGNVTDEDVAHMMMLKGLNYDNDEIGKIVGFDGSTVGDHLNRVETEAKSADSWEDVYWIHVLDAVFDDEFKQGVVTGLKKW